MDKEEFKKFINEHAEYCRLSEDSDFYFWISYSQIREFTKMIKEEFKDWSYIDEVLLGFDGAIGLNASDICDDCGFTVDEIFKIGEHDKRLI